MYVLNGKGFKAHVTGKQFNKINLAGKTCCKDALLHYATRNILSKGFKAFIELQFHLDYLKNNKKPFDNSFQTHCKPGFKEFQTLWKHFGNSLEIL